MRMQQSEHGEWRDALSADWSHYLAMQSLLPVPVPNDPEHCTEYLKGVIGLILTGGDDIVLSSPEDMNDNPRAKRDRTEVALVREAWERHLPVIGVCRGMQLLQWMEGGALVDMPEASHVAKEHDITWSKAAKRFGATGSMRVNSFHRHGIRKAEGWNILAESADGYIEAMEHPDKKTVAVMWHPERSFDDKTSAAFHATFVQSILKSFR